MLKALAVAHGAPRKFDGLRHRQSGNRAAQIRCARGIKCYLIAKSETTTVSGGIV